jgi:hypothetical protein
MLAYYCFINFGMPPHVFAELPYREKVLIRYFIDKEIKSRKEK